MPFDFISSFITLSVLIALSIALPTSVPVFIDTSISSGSPDSNFGTQTTSSVHFDDVYSTFYDLVFRFNISGVPVNSSLTSKIIFHQSEVVFNEAFNGPETVFNLQEVGGNWTETNVTWNNPPSFISTVLTNHQDSDVEKIVAPVTGIINTYRAQSRNFISFRLKGSSYPIANVYMREFVTPSFRPKLEIN